MEPLTIIMICVCVILVGIIVYLIVSKVKKMSPEQKNELFDKGILLVNYLKAAWSNDGKIDINEFTQVLKYLLEIIAFLGGITFTAAVTKTGSEEILAESEAVASAPATE